jgi:hypothetical protein
MAKSDASGENQKSDVDYVAEEVFTSEKREDIWAIVIVAIIFVFSIAFPTQVYHFFNKVLYLF